MSKKKYIIISTCIVVFALVYFSIISPIYENYKYATNVKNFTEDKENVFVNTLNGLIKINKGTNEINELKKFNFTVNEIDVDENDEKWVVSNLGYLDYTLYSFKNENKVTKHNSPFKINKNQIWNDWENIKIDQIGTKWILVHSALYKYELYSYDSFGNWKKYYFPEKGVEPNMLINEYNDIVFLSSTKVFFLENNGVMTDLDYKWSYNDYPENFSLDNSFTDKEHNIWVTGSSNEKYSLYRLQDIDFIKYNINKEIKALDSDTNGKVWIATEDGIEILNEKNSLISKKEISKMFIDSNNKKWIERNRSQSIECYDGKEWKSYDFEIFKHVLKDFFNNLF